MEAKTEEFSQSQQQSSIAAKLLAHPARVAILEYIINQNACIPGHVISEIPLSRPTVHQHLTALKEAGWIKSSIAGDKICYCVDFKVLQKDTAALLKHLQNWKNKTSLC